MATPLLTPTVDPFNASEQDSASEQSDHFAKGERAALFSNISFCNTLAYTFLECYTHFITGGEII